jgi:polyisoprenyl-teichoic acid--peptidoglycan teichoic acid transferase
MTTKKKIVNFISKIIASILTLLFIAVFVMIFIVNILPLKYSIPIFIFFLVIVFFLFDFSFDRRIKIWIKLILNFISIFFILIFVYTMIFVNNTFNFLEILRKSDNVEVYYLMVNNSSEYSKLIDLNNSIVAVFDSSKSTMPVALNKLKNDVNITESLNTGLSELASNLLNGDITSLLIESSFLKIIEEENESFSKDTKIIYEIEVDANDEINLIKVDPVKESFNVYISGIDTYGSLSTVSRSDVNIVATVDPISKKILLTNIPRDYYVQLRDKVGSKDKITHAGIYGINISIGTIEDLLDIEINYYVKLNFTSVVDIVDDLGGIVVNSDYNFTTVSDYTFVKGINYLNGEETLSFVRERKSFIYGDRTRGENQQKVIAAIINKIISPSILIKYNTLFKNLSSTFETNMDSSTIFNIVRNQLQNGGDWKMESVNLNGSDSFETTYSYGSQPLYVMIPNQDSINTAKNKINEFLNKE